MARFNILLRFALLTLVCLGTIFFSTTYGRYESFGENLLVNPLFQKNLMNWQVQQHGDSVSVHNGILTLSNTTGDNNRSVSVTQTIVVPSEQRLLIFTCEARALGVSPGRRGWETARVVIFPLTAEKEPRYDVPHTLVSQKGTTPWKKFEQVFRIPDENASVAIAVQLLNTSGTLKVRSISLRSAIEDPSYLKWRHVLILIWLISGLWIIWPLLIAMHDEVGRRGVLITAGIILVGTLLPANMKYGVTPYWLLPETEATGPFRADLLPTTVPFSFELIPAELDIYKLVHLLLFAIVGYLLVARRPYETPIWTQVGIVTLFALATESMQVLASGRGGSLGDVLIDMTGSFCGMLAASIWQFLDQRPNTS